MIDINDATMAAMRTAIDGLAARQRIIAQNIANAETPGYIAQRVTFESSLRSAMADGDPSAAHIGVESTSDPAGVNGNNVQLDQENVQLVESGLMFQAMTEALNTKFQILRTSLRRD